MEIYQESYFKILQILLQVLIIITCFSFNFYLYKNRHSFPYKYISILWEIVFITGILICQIYLMIYSTLINYNEDKYKKYFLLIRSIYIYYFHVILLLIIIARCYSLVKCWKFNELYLSKKFLNDTSSLQEEEIQFDLVYYSKKFYYYKLFLIISGAYTIIFILFGLIFFFNDKDSVWRNCPYYIFKFLYGFENIKKQIIPKLFPLIIYFVIYCILCFNIFHLYINPLKRDKFKIRLEICGLFIISVLYIDVKSMLIIFLNKSINYKLSFIIDSAYFLILTTHSIIITVNRYRTYSFKEGILNKEDFDQFMKSPSKIEIFKDYITRKNPEIQNLLPFYFDYLEFKSYAVDSKQKIKAIYIKKRNTSKMSIRSKRNIDSDGELDPQDEELINKYEENMKNMAKKIYKDYFSNLNMSNTSNFSDIDIDFPTDCQDKIIEVYKNNFDVEDLDVVFDDSFIWVESQLQKCFNEFIQKNDEVVKMKRILFYIDTFEIAC